jgi:hypothetical protein
MSPLKYATVTLALLAVAFAAAPATAGDVLARESAGPAKSPQAPRLAVEGNNDHPSWMVRVSVDREDRSYQLDETVRATVVSERPGYLYLFNVNARGDVSCLFPNAYQADNAIGAGQAVVVPDPKDTSWRITVRPPTGRELLKAVVTTKPLQAFKGVSLNARGGPTPLSRDAFRRLMVEAGTGREKLSPADQLRQYLQHSGEWAEHEIELLTGADRAPRERRVGLFVGISKYADPSVRSLSGPQRDARSMADAMKRACGLTANPRVLLNEQATLAAVRDAFRELAETTRPGDVVIVYWAGHGGRCAAADGGRAGAYDAFLLPYDGQLGSDSAMRRTTLLDRTFGRWVQALDGRRVLVILDTCHSGGQIEGQKAGTLGRGDLDPLKRYLRGVSVPDRVEVGAPGDGRPHFLASQVSRARAIGQRDAAVLAASTFRQFAFERREPDHMGVMTYYVLEALEKHGGPLTLRDIHGYVKGRVKSYVEANFEGATQDPVFSDQDGSPVVLKP